MKVKLTLVAELTYELHEPSYEGLSTPREMAEFDADNMAYEDIVNDDRAIVTVKGKVLK